MRMRLPLGLVLVSFAALACGPAPAPVAAPAPVLAVAVSPPVAPPPEVAGDDDGDPGPIPVTDADPAWGRRSAPVTIVAFEDFQDPFCTRAETTLAELRRVYGPDRLRIVWKNEPLSFHPKARPAAVVALALFKQLGNDAFWKTHDAMFGDQAHLDQVTASAPADAGTSLEALRASPAWSWAEGKVDGDHALGKSAGVSSTPAFFINGIFVSGAQPYDKFSSIIEEQIEKAQALVAQGTRPVRVYAELTRIQKTEVRPKEPPPEKKAEEDLVVHKVPVGKSAVRGKATALVTIVEVSEFQCPFCGRVAPTLLQVAREYGDKVRIVFKHNPLPFHPRAMPAAELAIEARNQKGDAGFWAAHDLLFKQECSGAKGDTSSDCMAAGGTWISNQTHLEDADLLAYATILGLDVKRVQAAIAGKKHEHLIQEDQDLADDLQATGTPHFFINGRRLVGAQPIEKFRTLIDAEIAKATPLVAQGLPAAKVYDTLQAVAAHGVPELPHKTLPAPTAQNPSHGPAGARVVVQVFADFQCPYCKKVTPTVAELEKLFPGKIRVIWRNNPLPFHQHAELAAEAAMEAFAQKGNAGFWAMHALLFENQGNPGGLERPALEGYAAQLGLDPVKFAAALDTRAHKARIDADVAVATAVGMTGTPAITVNGYFVSGAQPLNKFRRAVVRALAELK